MAWPLDDFPLWKARYDRHRMMFTRGVISRIEALDVLRNLRFRGDALSAEIAEWEHERSRYKKARHKQAFKQLEKFIEPGTVTPSSSV